MRISSENIEERLRAIAKSEKFVFEKYINQRENPRYFHADCSSSDGKRYRLKVVNPTAKDPASRCALYENRTYTQIFASGKLHEIVRLPEPIRPADQRRWDQYFFEEFIDAIQCTSDDFELIVNTLIEIRHHTDEIQSEINRAGKGCQVRPHEFSGATYRDRTFCESGRSLLGKNLMTNELYNRAMEAWTRWSLGERTCYCFAHGDFSFGNTMKSDGRLALIDFEHSHLGDPLIDLAHLYVNLLCDDEASAAKLRQMYFSRLENGHIKEEEAVFRRLTLERLLGKLNATDNEDKQRKILDLVETLIKE